MAEYLPESIYLPEKGIDAKKVFEAAAHDVRKGLSELDFKKILNPFDRSHGYQMKRDKVKVGVNVSSTIASSTAPYCPHVEVYFFQVKTRKGDTETTSAFFQPDAENMLSYIKRIV